MKERIKDMLGAIPLPLVIYKKLILCIYNSSYFLPGGQFQNPHRAPGSNEMDGHECILRNWVFLTFLRKWGTLVHMLMGVILKPGLIKLVWHRHG